MKGDEKRSAGETKSRKGRKTAIEAALKAPLYFTYIKKKGERAL